MGVFLLVQSTKANMKIDNNKPIRTNLLQRDIKELINAEGQRNSTVRNKIHFLKILEQTRGMVSVCCMKSGVGRSTYYHWMKKDKKFKETVEKLQSSKGEIIEDRLMALALEGSVPALKYLHAYYNRGHNTRKDTEVHIYHHTDKVKKEDDKEKTFTDVVDEIIDRITVGERRDLDEK